MVRFNLDVLGSHSDRVMTGFTWHPNEKGEGGSLE